MQNVIENKTAEIKSKRITNIDFNCDLAQGFGVYRNRKEYDLLEYVSSVNIAAGVHAGDPLIIKESFERAKAHNVVIGANIGYFDRQGFGLRQMVITDEELEALVIYQVSALMSFAKAYGAEIEFVRPHGAMYAFAAEDFEFSKQIALAIKKCSKWLSYVGSAGDVLDRVGEEAEISVVREYNFLKNYVDNQRIDYTLNDITDADFLSKRLHKFLQYSQLEDSEHNVHYIEADTLHFTANYTSLRLLKEAAAMITPLPVNYSKVKSSGWV